MGRGIGSLLAGFVASALTLGALLLMNAREFNRAPRQAPIRVTQTPRPMIEPPPPVEPPPAIERPRPRPEPRAAPRPLPARTPRLPSRMPRVLALIGLANLEQGPAGGSMSIFDEHEVDSAPQKLAAPAPEYPWALRRRAVEGQVEAFLIVDAEGRVVEVSLGERSPPEVFDRAVIDTLRAWTFLPGRHRGRAVACRCRVVVTFRLER